MSRRRLEVQVCLLSGLIRRYGAHPTSDLLGVDYTYSVPPDTEFPKNIAQMDMFVRFFVANLGPTRIGVRVEQVAPNGTRLQRVSDHWFTAAFDPADAVREMSFRLVNVSIPGVGLYAARVGRQVRRKWKRPAWRTLGTDYFQVVR